MREVYSRRSKRLMSIGILLLEYAGFQGHHLLACSLFVTFIISSITLVLIRIIIASGVGFITDRKLKHLGRGYRGLFRRRLEASLLRRRYPMQAECQQDRQKSYSSDTP